MSSIDAIRVCCGGRRRDNNYNDKHNDYNNIYNNNYDNNSAT